MTVEVEAKESITDPNNHFIALAKHREQQLNNVNRDFSIALFHVSREIEALEMETLTPQEALNESLKQGVAQLAGMAMVIKGMNKLWPVQRVLPALTKRLPFSLAFLSFPLVAYLHSQGLNAGLIYQSFERNSRIASKNSQFFETIFKGKPLNASLFLFRKGIIQ